MFSLGSVRTYHILAFFRDLSTYFTRRCFLISFFVFLGFLTEGSCFSLLYGGSSRPPLLGLFFPELARPLVDGTGGFWNLFRRRNRVKCEWNLDPESTLKPRPLDPPWLGCRVFLTSEAFPSRQQRRLHHGGSWPPRTPICQLRQCSSNGDGELAGQVPSKAEKALTHIGTVLPNFKTNSLSNFSNFLID